jgi:hypothetical protein
MWVCSKVDSSIQKFFLWHAVYFYRFCLKYIEVPFFSLARSAIALQQAERMYGSPLQKKGNFSKSSSVLVDVTR